MHCTLSFMCVPHDQFRDALSDCIFVPHNKSSNRNQNVYNKSSPEQMLYNICSTFIKEFP